METAVVDAKLLISSSCPRCATVADAVLRLTKNGTVGRLEVVNLDRFPEQAAMLGVRSVPWLRLGPFELSGAYPYAELARWAHHAAAGSGWPEYLAYLLTSHRLALVLEFIDAEPRRLDDLLVLMNDDDLDMGTRIGISAVIEHLADTDTLRACIPQLRELTLSGQPQTRADACHFLGLAGDRDGAPVIRRLLDDEQADVREIALETLAVLDLADGAIGTAS